MMQNQIKAILLDLDGTLYASGSQIPGASGAIAELRRQGYVLRFFTNTDSKTVPGVLAALRGYSLDVAPEELFTPVVAARLLLGAHASPNVALLVSAAVSEVLQEFVGTGPVTHVVVADCRDTLDYPALDAAFRAIRGGAELIALQRGRYFKSADGDHVDTGAIVAGLEYSTGVTARLLGKPSQEYFALAATSAGYRADQIVVVGDDATTDMAMAVEAGAVAIQVRTGKYGDQASDGLQRIAHHVIDSIADLPALMGELA